MTIGTDHATRNMDDSPSFMVVDILSKADGVALSDLPNEMHHQLFRDRGPGSDAAAAAAAAEATAGPMSEFEQWEASEATRRAETKAAKARARAEKKEERARRGKAGEAGRSQGLDAGPRGGSKLPSIAGRRNRVTPAPSGGGGGVGAVDDDGEEIKGGEPGERAPLAWFEAAREGKRRDLQYHFDVHQQDLNVTNVVGATALHCAADHTRFRAASLLVKLGAGVNIADRIGFTPLMAAANRGNLKIVQMLLDNQADAMLRNIALETALDVARKQVRAVGGRVVVGLQEGEGMPSRIVLG